MTAYLLRPRHAGSGASLDQEGIFVQEDPALQEATASEPLTIEVRLAYRCCNLATILQQLQQAVVRLVSLLHLCNVFGTLTFPFAYK